MQFNAYALGASKHSSYRYKRTKKVVRKSQPKNVKKETEKKENKFVIPLIEDETANQLDKTQVKKILYKPLLLNDDATEKFDKKKTTKPEKYKTEILQDEPVIAIEQKHKYKRQRYSGVKNYNKGIKVVIKPIQKINTKTKRIVIKNEDKSETYRLPLPELNETVIFRVVNDVKFNGETVIPKNNIVTASVGAVSPRAMGGAPAEMTLEDFEVKDINGEKIGLNGTLNASGYSLSVWIGLAELATTPFLFGLAVPLLRVLPGGQATVTPRKKYVLYYSPVITSELSNLY